MIVQDFTPRGVNAKVKADTLSLYFPILNTVIAHGRMCRLEAVLMTCLHVHLQIVTLQNLDHTGCT